MDCPSTNISPLGTFASQAKDWLQTLSMHCVKRLEIPSLPPVPPWQHIQAYVVLENECQDNDSLYLYIYENYLGFKKIFTDGSKTLGNTCSVGSATYNAASRTTVCWKLRGEHSVLAAELYAIWKTIEPFQDDAPKTLLFSDSKSALQLIRSMNPKTHREIVFKIQAKLASLNQSSSQIIHWVKGHSNIHGNVIADAAANHAHKNNRTELTRLSGTEYLSILRRKLIEYWTEYWNLATNMGDKGRYLKKFRRTMSYNQTIFNLKNRRSQVLINRFRIGHIGVKSYLNRFNVADSPLCENPSCEEEELEETITHFLLSCPAHQEHRDILRRKLSDIGVQHLNLETLLLSETAHADKHHTILQILLEYLNKTGRTATYF